MLEVEKNVSSVIIIYINFINLFIHKFKKCGEHYLI